MIDIKTNKTFGDIQKEYDKLYEVDGVRDEDRAYQFHAKTVLKKNPSTKRILDIACGAGYFLREFRVLKQNSPVIELHGTDISGGAIDKAKKECPEGKYTLAVAEAMPYENAFFDAITCLGSLEHFLDISQAVKEMKRIGSPDALFYIMVPNMFWYRDIWKCLTHGTRVTRNQTQERFLTMGEWQDVLKDAGLYVQETLKYNGIAKNDFKQLIKDCIIPVRFSYHFIFICRQSER